MLEASADAALTSSFRPYPMVMKFGKFDCNLVSMTYAGRYVFDMYPDYVPLLYL